MRFIKRHLALCALILEFAFLAGCTTADPEPDKFAGRPPIYDEIPVYGNDGHKMDQSHDIYYPWDKP